MANEEATLVPQLIEDSDYRLKTTRVDLTSVPEVTQILEVEGENVPEITHTLSVGHMLATPIDKTLSISDMAADAKAVGDRFAAVDEDVADLASDLSSSVSSMKGWLDTLEAKTGADIPETSASGAATISSALDAIRSSATALITRVAAVEGWTGSNIAENSESEAGTIAVALTSIRSNVSESAADISTIKEWTGYDIPENNTAGALSVGAAIAEIRSDVAGNTEDIDALQTSVGNLQDGISEIQGTMVKSINSELPDDSGNVAIHAVEYDQQVLSDEQKEQARVNIGAAGEADLLTRILTPTQSVAIPASGAEATYTMAGLTGSHVVVRWRFSASPENAPPCDLEIDTDADSFTITNNSDESPSETIQPVFALPAAVAATVSQ